MAHLVCSDFLNIAVVVKKTSRVWVERDEALSYPAKAYAAYNY
jgi:hypothetical protein